MKFNVLVADPPWSYNNKKTGGNHKSGSIQKYKTMSRRQLIDLQDLIEDVTTNDCVCFLWVTNPMLYDGLQILGNWFFEYKTMVTWVKSNHFGMGYWFRGNTEHILVGAREKAKPLRCQKINVFTCSPNGHCVKPYMAYALIEEATKNIPNRKILELFARKQYKDWTCIGEEITGNNIRKDLAALCSAAEGIY